MRLLKTAALVLMMFAASACGDSSGPSRGFGAEGGAGGSGGLAGTGGSAGMGGSAGAAGSAGSAGTGGTGGVATINISGVVMIDSVFGSTPADGATVSIVGTANTATTNAMGEFSMDVAPGNYFIGSALADHWGTLVYGEFAEDASEVGVNVVPDGFVDAFTSGVGGADKSKAVIITRFYNANGLGGESATLSEAFGYAFTIGDVEGTDGMMNPTCESDITVASALPVDLCDEPNEELIFVNVDPAAAVTITPMGAMGTVCALSSDVDFPAIAHTFTNVDIDCVLP